MTTALVEKKCADCGRGIKRFPFDCPSCKITLCWKCWDKHYSGKVCDYSKATQIDVHF